MDTVVSDHFLIILSSELSLKSSRLPKIMNRRFFADKKAFMRRLVFLGICIHRCCCPLFGSCSVTTTQSVLVVTFFETVLIKRIS